MPGGLEVICSIVLGTPRRRLAGGENSSRRFQTIFKCRGERVRAAKHAPRDPSRILEGRHGLVEIVERGGGVLAERPRVIPPRPEREYITFSENTPRHGYQFAQHRLGFFEAL